MRKFKIKKIARNQPNQDFKEKSLRIQICHKTIPDPPHNSNSIKIWLKGLMSTIRKFAACVSKQVTHLNAKNLINRSLCLCAEIQGKISTHLQCDNISSSSPK
ncbi:hypothetical protein VP01_2525g1 [Puccinia sorghi]|uniref:Uncharacterized protein n=1 Tax=Puccinia sorghi TaxID=27349 RepID=A0A0L6V7A4_9BASI|nr:hypothetical protein VP01_2525g1 [Puccinia sorghi]